MFPIHILKVSAMKFRPILSPVLAVLVALGSTVHAEERPDHFKGLEPETIEQAVQNFSEYNRRLDALLTGEGLSPADLSKVHEMTYTLENALAFINEELGQLAVSLEEVHIASEEAGADEVKAKGQSYLGKATRIIE